MSYFKIRGQYVMSIVAILSTLVILLTSCEKDTFSGQCLELVDIIAKSNSYLEVTGTKNNYDKDGEIISTSVEFNKKKSNEFLSSKMDRIRVIYKSFKSHINTNSQYSTDSAYAVALTNQFVFFVTEKKLDNTCKYLEKINTRKIAEPSEWVQENVFAPLLLRNDDKEAWRKLPSEQRYEAISGYLLLNYNECTTQKE